MLLLFKEGLKMGPTLQRKEFALKGEQILSVKSNPNKKGSKHMYMKAISFIDVYKHSLSRGECWLKRHI